MATNPTIVWFRLDLRTSDNPALHAAVERGGPVIPVYIWAPHEEEWAPGAASKWWLHKSLTQLKTKIEGLGSQLVLRQGDSEQIFHGLVEETGADTVLWNRRYKPELRVRDSSIKKKLKARGVDTRTFNGSLLFEPHEIETQSGGPYKVFTPFWKNCLSKLEVSPPLPDPNQLTCPDSFPASDDLASFELLPEIDWAGGIEKAWTPGEPAARRGLEVFISSSLAEYPEERDRPDKQGTSRMSPHLHHGEISPRQIHYELSDVLESGSSRKKAAEEYLREIGWREFAYHLLFHFPETTSRPLYDKFSDFPWIENQDALDKWKKGKTGFPLVDAGMRELWTTGWMHNRVRMVVASFLVKDLLIHWREGAEWFWDTLVDADLASNTMGWQWAAGSGADAAPYFRIFNPVTQGKKFDPKGEYIRKWIPELTHASTSHVHEPWNMSADDKAAASDLEATYPEPIVDHGEARDRALKAYEQIK